MKLINKKIDFNPYLLSKIQPVGGVKFKERSILKGDGYEACIQIYDYPTFVNDFWLEQLLTLDDAIATIDIGTEERTNALEQINSAISEQLTRVTEVKNNVDRIEANNTANMLISLVNDITTKEEVIKKICIRYYVGAKTESQLENKIEYVLNQLESIGYRGAVFLNEQEYEWQSLFMSAQAQKLLPNKRVGKPLPSISLGAGYPFHFVELNDRTGMFMGTTRTGGNVILDIFTKDNLRKSYNALAVGVMGSGKSTLLKKILNNNAIVGNTARILDIAGEFKTLVKELNGKSIALDGSDGIINPLQIFATIIDEETNEVLIEQSYMQHISKVSMIYQFLSPEAKQDELREFEKILSNFYSFFGIDKDKATNYTSEEYPIMSDLLSYIKNELYTNEEKGIIKAGITLNRQTRLENIILNIDNIVRNYGKLFNGHSSIQNLESEQLVSFELRSLVDIDKRIFNAQIFNILTMLWNNALIQGLKEKQLYDEGKISTDEARKFLLLLDEAHKFINSNNMLAVDYLIRFEREARKYFAGLMFVTQSIRDVVPNITNGEVFEKIRTLFELTQYKFIMQQDSNSKEMLKSIFDGQLTDSEIENIPNFETGDVILNIAGYKNVNFKIEISDKEKYLFKGGA